MAVSSFPDGTLAERTALVAGLSKPGAYGHAVDPPIHVIETHISHLFLTGRYVYKVKKPVDLGFVDYSTLSARRRLTNLEFDLNKQVSPDVYIGVEPVTVDADGKFSVGGGGEPIEYALKMRQLPSECTFARLLNDGSIGEAEIRRAAELIARFHAAAGTVPPDSPLGSAEVMRAVTGDNLAVMERFAGIVCDRDDVDDVRSYTMAFLETHAGLFADRIRNGFVRDCHGDLHAGNLFLDHDGIHVIDRIEFNDQFRFIDVVSDLAFLAMDLAHAGRADLAALLAASYETRTGDPDLGTLLPFYVMHRACVRSKVTSLRLDEPGLDRNNQGNTITEEAASYGRLAARTVAAQRPQAVYLMAGLMGSGKSTMADELTRRWHAERFTSDVVRKTLAGIDPQRVSDESRRAELYAREMSDRTYSEMLRLGGEALERGSSVVLDAAFIKRQHRADAVALARRHGVDAYIVEVRAPEAVALSRLHQRYQAGTSPSDGKPELLAWHRSESEPVSIDEANGHIILENDGAVDTGAKKMLAGLWRALLKEKEQSPVD